MGPSAWDFFLALQPLMITHMRSALGRSRTATGRKRHVSLKTELSLQIATNWSNVSFVMSCFMRESNCGRPPYTGGVPLKSAGRQESPTNERDRGRAVRKTRKQKTRLIPYDTSIERLSSQHMTGDTTGVAPMNRNEYCSFLNLSIITRINIKCTPNGEKINKFTGTCWSRVGILIKDVNDIQIKGLNYCTSVFCVLYTAPERHWQVVRVKVKEKGNRLATCGGWYLLKKAQSSGGITLGGFLYPNGPNGAGGSLMAGDAVLQPNQPP